MKIVGETALLWVSVVAGASPSAALAQVSTLSPLEGLWHGTLGKGHEAARLSVEIHRAKDGDLAGSVTELDRDRAVYAIDRIEVSGDKITLVVGEAGGGFTGVFSADRAELTGAWSELAISTPLELVRSVQ